MKIRATSTFLVLALLIAGAALAEKASLQRVEARKVCMITEQAFEKDQIPVTVDGKTYYGCCEMCRKTLATDASKRVATDPVSGKTIDKADAVIAALADGKILYFENEKNLEAYAAELTRKQ